MKYPNLFKAIQNYIVKADKDLENQLKKEGFIEPKKTVNSINEINDKLAEIFEYEKNLFLQKIGDETDIEKILDEVLPTLKVDDKTDDKIQSMFYDFFSDFVKTYANEYMKEIDNDLSVENLTNKTKAWIEDWSEELGKIMHNTSNNDLQSILSTALDDITINDVREKLKDAYTFSPMRARRAAVTEVLTAHRMAAQESATQSVVVETKTWKHTGAHKNEPRPNHVVMNGQTVGKNEKFELLGVDGVTYYPMYPGDIILPARERINCHCIVSYNIKKSAFGLFVEEKKKLQQKAIEDDDRKWEKELDEKNKAKVGIDDTVIKYNWLKKKTKEEQVAYFGGVKAKWALLESGVIKNDSELEALFIKDKGKRRLKTLPEIKKDGIMLMNHNDLNHAVKCDFTNLKNPNKPAGGNNGGRMKGGGHSQENIKSLEEKGIKYNIEKTYDNGVRIGGVNEHKEKDKQLGKSGQAWFPETWTEEDILLAATYTANNPIHKNEYNHAIECFAIYKDVTVGVFVDKDNNITTAFPDKLQREEF